MNLKINADEFNILEIALNDFVIKNRYNQSALEVGTRNGPDLMKQYEEKIKYGMQVLIKLNNSNNDSSNLQQP